MSLFKWSTAAVLMCGVTAVSLAADDVKAELKDFKWKCKFDGGESLGGFDDGEGRFFFYSFGTATSDVNIPEDGEYTITIEASCTEAEKEFAKFKLSVGEEVVAKEHALTAEDKKTYKLTGKLKKGKHPLVIEFLNDAYKDGEYDRNLFIHDIKIEKAKK